MLPALALFAAVASAQAPLPVGFEAPKVSTSSTPAVRQAQALMEKDLYDEAIGLLERERNLSPGSSEVLLNLGWAQWHVQRAAEAELAWRLLYFLDPRNALFVRLYAAIEVEVGRAESGELLAREALRLAPGDVDASLVLCKALVALGRLPEAQGLADGLVSSHPRHVGVLYQAAEIHDLRRRFDRSLSLYDRLVRLEPRDARFGRRRADALYELERFEEAIHEWKRLIAFDPPDAHSLRALGRVYWSVQAYDEAWEFWLRLAELRPNDPAVLFLVAGVQLERGRFTESLRIAQRILRLSPEDADGTTVLARALARLGRPAEARELLRSFIRRHPDELATRFEMADVLYRLGWFSEALEQYDALLRRKPGVPAYRRLRAQALFSLGKHSEALREWNDLLGGKPPDIPSLYNLAWSYASLERLNEAVAAASRLAALEPSKPDGFILMAGIELDRGRAEEGARAAAQALALAPAHRDANVVMARAELALGDAEAARARLRALLPKYRHHPPLLFQLAEIESADGRPEEALPLLERLGTLSPASNLYRRRRGDALYELGRYDEATAEWRRLSRARAPDPAAIERLVQDAVARQAWGEAADGLRRLADLQPLTERQWRLLATVQLADGRPGDALAAAEAAAREGGGAAALFLRAEALEALGRYVEAEELQREVLAHHPDAERPALAVARLAEARGDHPAAVALLREAHARLGWPQLKLREARLLADMGKTADAARLSAESAKGGDDGLTILAYQGLALFERGDGVALETFRRHLAALKAAGYHSVTLRRLLEARGGKALAPRSVLVTVDDARARALEAADAILEEAGWSAVLFIPLGRHRPGYPAPEQLRRLATSGRWEIQALGLRAGELVAVDASGRTGRFLANRLWLAEAGRLETPAEFAERVEREFRAARSELDAARGEGAAAFAFPGGDFGQSGEGNHPGAASVNRGAAPRSFDLAFAEDPWGYNRVPWPAGPLRRFEVPREWSGERLASHVTSNDPRIQAVFLEASIHLAEGKPQRALRLYRKLESEGVRTAELYAREGAAYELMGLRYRAYLHYSRAVKLEPDNVRYRELYLAARMAIGPHVEPEFTASADNYSRSESKTLMRLGTSIEETQVQAWGGLGRHVEGGVPAVEGREMGGLVRIPLGLRGWADLGYVRRSYRLGGAAFDGAATQRPRGRVRDGEALSAAAALSVTPGLEAELGLGVNDVESARAILEGRRVRTGSAGLRWDLSHDWLAAFGGELRGYNDGNRERAGRVTLGRILSGRALAGRLFAGYSFSWSRASFASPQYYSPLDLRQHMLTVSARPGGKGRRALLEASAGYGTQDGTGRLVQAVRAGFEWLFLERFQWSLKAGYSRSPTYIGRELSSGLTIGF